jgi:hypothetical protein
MKPPYIRFHTMPMALCLLMNVILAAGCGGYTAAEHRVEATTARSALEQVLDSWRQGASPESWQLKSPQIVVQDMEWRSGAKLQSFEILDEGEAIDANLHCRVKLKLLDPKKGGSEKTVTYLVGTSPVITVFRSPGT